MPSYSYKAVDGGGQSVSGVLTAENYQVALRQLEEKHLFPVKVTEGIEQGPLRGGSRRKVKARHLTTFYGQLSDLLRAGVPMLRSLDVLSRQASQGTFQQVIKELREDVAGGNALGDSMGKHPRVFSPLHASMVRAGEAGGFLEDVLQRIAIFSEKQDELRNKAIGSMIYPVMLVVIGGLIVSGLLVFVVPKIREHIRPENMNILTEIVFGISDFMNERSLVVVVSVVMLLVGINAFKQTESGQRIIEVVKLKLPIFGKIFTMIAICRFCRILGTMLHNGVPILQALRISKDSAGNQLLSNTIDEAADSVRKGAALSEPLGTSGLFPPAVVDMIAVAEESNNLETVLVQIAETNEKATAQMIDLGVRVLEPILLAFVALIVLAIAIALLLPILTLGAGVGG